MATAFHADNPSLKSNFKNLLINNRGSRSIGFCSINQGFIVVNHKLDVEDQLVLNQRLLIKNIARFSINFDNKIHQM